MKNELKFLEITEKDWDKFERSKPNFSFFQSVMRIKKRNKMGYKNYILGVKSGDSLVAGGVLIGRGSEFWMAYGPLIDWDDAELVQFFLENLAKFARQHKMAKIEIFPNLLLNRRSYKGEILEHFNHDDVKQIFKTNGWRYEGETTRYEMKAGRWAFIKDLSEMKNIEELRKSYRKTLRAHLRKSDGQVEIAKLTRAELPKIVNLIDESDAQNNVNGRALEYYQMMFDEFGDEIEFLVAQKVDDKTPVAGAIFIWHGGEVASYLSGMDRKYRDLNGRAWLQDFIMQKALERGINRVNFFWVEGKFSDNRLLEFKSGFGGEIEEYIGGFELVLRPLSLLTKKIARKAKSLIKK
ncbi:MAG: aminoacyltransferase [Candidatus Nomurabacteria bacterium]|jgi:lipid II:glycine glycyltransferase (peptidoglycan interpeptide bridge formation enzyme)|nr:aminoacyltransferase [Candidatus Nomurabacteria bacterium]